MPEYTDEAGEHRDSEEDQSEYEEPKLPVCPYHDHITNDLEARSTWNKMDDEILQRRLGKRKKKKTKPYKGAPNSVVPIIDDNVTEKTDQEISMILNTPYLAYFVPIGPHKTTGQPCPPETKMKAQMAFDTYLRHICHYRKNKEEALDIKNARGFAVSKVMRKKVKRWGVITVSQTVDPKDCIVPVDTKDPEDAERLTCVLRWGKRKLKGKKNEGWFNVDRLLHKFNSNKTEDSPVTSEHDDQNSEETTETLIGLNISDHKNDKFVIWEVYHYATQWDVEEAEKNGVTDIVLNRRCVSYYCPDWPEFLLYAYPLKDDDEYRKMDEQEAIFENAAAMQEGRQPEYSVLVKEGEDKSWGIVQNRFENRSSLWYSCRGIGHKNMDNQISATAKQNAKLTWLDYTTNLMWQSDGTYTNEGNVRIQLGAVLPRGLSPAILPQPPSNLDFEVDQDKRDASRRAGVNQSLYSGQVDERRKLQKTATEVMDSANTTNMVSTASVDRFNDPDKLVLQLIWEDLARMKKDLPIIRNDNFMGTMPKEVYEYEWMVIPAASAKTLNPDIQFAKNREMFDMAASYAQATGVDLHNGLKYILSFRDPYFADIVLIDPNEQGPQGQPPMYQALQQMQQAMDQNAQMDQQQEEDIQKIMTFGIENAERIDKIEESTEEAKTQQG